MLRLFCGGMLLLLAACHAPTAPSCSTTTSPLINTATGDTVSVVTVEYCVP